VTTALHSINKLCRAHPVKLVHKKNRSAMLNTHSPHRVRTGLNRYAAQFAMQLGLIFGAAIVYFGVRSATEGSVALANDHGHDVARLESVLGLDVEAQLQSLVLNSNTLSTMFNWIYIWGHWPAIAATLIWLHRRDNDLFLRLRNALFISGAIGVVIFVLYPVTPPRLLDIGIVDTVTEQSNSYRVLQPPSLINKYAAVPSLHVGWNFLVGLALYQAATSRRLRLLGILSPIAMIAAVVLTGNHYVMDAAAGLLVASAGWIAAGKVQSLRPLIASWTPRPTMVIPPAVPSLASLPGDPTNHCLAVPAASPHNPSEISATATKIAPRSIICNPGDAPSTATYCGRIAAKNTIDLGFATPTMNPSTTRDRLGRNP
jgi:hypothetical protein